MKKFATMWLRFWSQALILVLRFFFGMKIVVKGRENLPPVSERICYIANHQSMLDIPAIVSLRRYPGIIGKVELKKIPLLNLLMHLMKCVYIDRSSLKESMKAIIKGTEQLKEGYPMMIFPEGTRSKTYEFGEFKAGSFRMAKKAEAIICPICIQNTRKCLEDRASFFPIKVYVSVLPPVDTTKLSEDELKNVHETVKDMIAEEYRNLPLYSK